MHGACLCDVVCGDNQLMHETVSKVCFNLKWAGHPVAAYSPNRSPNLQGQQLKVLLHLHTLLLGSAHFCARMRRLVVR